MFRTAIVGALVALLALPASALADSKAPSAPKSSSTTKKVVWTIVGAGAGFAAGTFIGLNKFDDAINSDRKVWLSAIGGAAGGGIAGWLVGRKNSTSGAKSSAAPPSHGRTRSPSAGSRP